MSLALILVDHGSRKSEANNMLKFVAAQVAQQYPNIIVEIAHMELAKPDIEDAVNACVAKGATHIKVMPYMLSPGRHATQDIPKLAKAAASHHPHLSIEVTPPIGIHPKMTDIIADRAKLNP